MRFGRSLEEQLRKRGIGGFVRQAAPPDGRGLYGEYILAHYSREEIEQAQNFLRPERDELFTYSGLDLLLKRYVIHDRAHAPLETPQEMFLGIALHLAMREKRDRMAWVQKFYDMLSRMHVTMATPTLSNARKPYHQLSSCFIDTCRLPGRHLPKHRQLCTGKQIRRWHGHVFRKVRAAGGSIRGFEARPEVWCGGSAW
ncbi:MAG: ribonucleotide reductase N-terminal alpha domain-containing protein [Ruthenibacterium lactatiformans]